MKRILTIVGLTVLLLPVLFGCGKKEDDRSGRSEVDFEVVPKEELPAPLAEAVEENKKDEIRMTYMDGEDLYLVRGYGEQATGGYSISVLECSEDEEKVYLDTRLLGPENPDEISRDPSYPYLALRIDMRDKEVVIQ
ncbi:MAG TPA: protease complex subunit PrcB family protein [Candidatus Choladousia intestinavium]|uniref:Protease complex subunit PrcB family protein n=1 Tax=Candidatus Choladousia intestinavium TaxID=2840727 RepID=A0A9D1AED0_9FIRM|nr:protease complex subunit PrcB family protein [Candidatus Choladousia intestinavium]